MSGKCKKTHDDFRKCICMLCFKKCKQARAITDHQRKLVEDCVISGLERFDERLPTALCTTCRLALTLFEKGEGNLDRVNIFDYSQLKPLSRVTRTSTSTSCDCLLCEIGRSTINAKGVPSHRPVGRPKSDDFESQHPLRLCSLCLCEISRGKSHTCTVNDRVSNIQSMIDVSPPKTDEKIASHILKEKSNVNNSSNVSLSKCSGGRPLNVSIGKSTPTKPTSFSASDMRDIQIDLGLSVNKTLQHARRLRYQTSNRKCVEANLKKHLEDFSHKLDDYFKVHQSHLKKPDGFEPGLETPVVYCSDMDSLIETVLLERMKDFEKVELKIGIDGGGGFLKVCLNIIGEDSENVPPTKRRKYSEVARDLFKDSSVQKLLILAIAPNVTENYSNVFDIWRMLKFEDSLAQEALKTRFATDLKMCNILLGLMSHASSHPCSWCDIDRYV